MSLRRAGRRTALALAPPHAPKHFATAPAAAAPKFDVSANKENVALSMERSAIYEELRTLATLYSVETEEERKDQLKVEKDALYAMLSGKRKSPEPALADPPAAALLSGRAQVVQLLERREHAGQALHSVQHAVARRQHHGWHNGHAHCENHAKEYLCSCHRRGKRREAPGGQQQQRHHCGHGRCRRRHRRLLWPTAAAKERQT